MKSTKNAFQTWLAQNTGFANDIAKNERLSGLYRGDLIIVKKILKSLAQVCGDHASPSEYDVQSALGTVSQLMGQLSAKQGTAESFFSETIPWLMLRYISHIEECPLFDLGDYDAFTKEAMGRITQSKDLKQLHAFFNEQFKPYIEARLIELESTAQMFGYFSDCDARSHQQGDQVMSWVKSVHQRIKVKSVNVFVEVLYKSMLDLFLRLFAVQNAKKIQTNEKLSIDANQFFSIYEPIFFSTFQKETSKLGLAALDLTKPFRLDDLQERLCQLIDFIPVYYRQPLLSRALKAKYKVLGRMFTLADKSRNDRIKSALQEKVAIFSRYLGLLSPDLQQCFDKIVAKDGAYAVKFKIIESDVMDKISDIAFQKKPVKLAAIEIYAGFMHNESALDRINKVTQEACKLKGITIKVPESSDAPLQVLLKLGELVKKLAYLERYSASKENLLSIKEARNAIIHSADSSASLKNLGFSRYGRMPSKVNALMANGFHDFVLELHKYFPELHKEHLALSSPSSNDTTPSFPALERSLARTDLPVTSPKIPLPKLQFIQKLLDALKAKDIETAKKSKVIFSVSHLDKDLMLRRLPVTIHLDDAFYSKTKAMLACILAMLGLLVTSKKDHLQGENSSAMLALKLRIIVLGEAFRPMEHNSLFNRFLSEDGRKKTAKVRDARNVLAHDLLSNTSLDVGEMLDVLRDLSPSVWQAYVAVSVAGYPLARQMTALLGIYKKNVKFLVKKLQSKDAQVDTDIVDKVEAYGNAFQFELVFIENALTRFAQQRVRKLDQLSSQAFVDREPINVSLDEQLRVCKANFHEISKKTFIIFDEGVKQSNQVRPMVDNPPVRPLSKNKAICSGPRKDKKRLKHHAGGVTQVRKKKQS